MNFWLVNHSWSSFRATQEYCGFMLEAERDKIKVGDGIVYFGQGLVFGIFEAVALVDDEFNGWEKKYHIQVKLKPIAVAEKGLVAKPLQNKIQLQKVAGGSPNLMELTEKEFSQIKSAIESKKMQLVFE